MNATDQTVRAALSAEPDGTRYEWGVITASSLAEWERKARAILRANAIPDTVRAEMWMHA